MITGLLALGVIVALGATASLVSIGISAFWLLPLAVVLLLGVSSLRGVRADESTWRSTSTSQLQQRSVQAQGEEPIMGPANSQAGAAGLLPT